MHIITEGTPKGTQITFKSWKKLTDYFTRDTNQENDVGNDYGCDSVVPQLHFSSFFLLFLSFSFFFPTSEPLNPSPSIAIYREKSFWGRRSSPRRAGCLGMKPFHGPGEPDASLGELGSRKIQKRPVCPLPWYLFVFLIKTPSDSLLRTVTDTKYHNSTSKNQNIISNDIPRTK